jgi:hypothetical protein
MQDHLRLREEVEQRRVDGLPELCIGTPAASEHDCEHTPRGSDPGKKRQPRP